MDEKLITLLEKIADELAGIGRSVSAIGMLAEDGFFRSVIENNVVEKPKKQRR